MIGKRLKELREEKGLSQEKLSREILVGCSTIGMYETDRRDPNYEITIKIADFFGVSIDYLLGRTNIKNPVNNYFKDLQKKFDETTQDLSDEEILDALKFYKEMKNKVKNK